MAFNLPTEEEARAILADQMEAQARRMHDIDYRTPGPLQQAAGAGDVELVRDLLAAGEDPEGMRATRAEFTSQARVLCPQARRWLDDVGELADPALVQRASDALAALEVTVGLDPGVETNPIEADLSDSEGTSDSEGY